MAHYQTTIDVSTQGHAQILNISDAVHERLQKSSVQNGIACLFVPGSTCALTTLEFEPGCVADLQRLFDEIVPADREYEHHLRWGDGNGHSHVRAALLGPSLAFPVVQREAQLGTWQQIVLVDFDNRGRDRQILFHIVGDA